MLTVTFSNKYQELQDCLLKAVATSRKPVFTPEELIIPSAAMQRRLELAMAQHFGVCANVRFSYLGQWVWRQVAQLTSLPDASPFTPETLVWRIRRILENKTFVQSHPRLNAYLEHADAVMRYDLASQLASLIDQTMTYRPGLVDAWSTNKLICMPGGTRSTAKDQQWQAELWRRILQETGNDRHLSAILHKLDNISDKTSADLRQSGTRHVFCPPAIAPLYIDILNRFGQWMDLHLYVLNPCREYWFDIVDRKRLSYLAAAGQADFHESGNHLLASWGKQTQAMIDLLFENTALFCDEQHLFIANAEQGKTTLLAQVQDAILDLHNLPPLSLALKDGDRSIEVHLCHSMTRELEVLQDQLLAMFASDNTLTPDQVLVVTPDLESAAPLIDAVFGTARDKRRIPYTITGLGSSRINLVASALLDLLSLASSRFVASDVFRLLQQPVVAQCFGLGDADLTSIHRWMTESGIRWGLNAEHRRGLELPDTEHYSFSDGMQRLLLGYALPSDHAIPFQQRLPAGNIEGSDAAALGCFWQFVQQISAMQRQVVSPKSAKEWHECLIAILDTFTQPSGNQIDDGREARARIRDLCNNMQQGGGDHLVERDVMLRALKLALDDPARGGVPTGGVTFTSMTSLRNLPYRVVCAVAMNDGAFPSIMRPAEFDLIAIDPKRGDRQRRLDERNLFLDLLLAAGDRLYLSYTGRNIRDNSVMPPSVLVSDLIDYLVPAIDDANARKRILIEHPLQAFSVEYFRQQGDDRILSSNSEYFSAIKQPLTGTAPAPAPATATDNIDDEGEEDATQSEASQPFFLHPLAEPDAEWRHLMLDQLLQFFRNPSRYLLRQRLGMAFPETQEDLQDEEPFLPEWGEKTALADRVLPLFLEACDPELIRTAALAGTEYPPGEMGAALLERELIAMDAFTRKLKPELAQPCHPPISRSLNFKLGGEEWTLTHSFNDLRNEGLICYRFDEVRPNDYLAGWILHLFLNASTPSGVKPQTVWHSRNGSYELMPVQNAHAQLLALLDLYRLGLSRPLHFYPKSAWAYVSSRFDLSKAHNKWRGARNEEFGEGRDPAYLQALRGQPDPLDNEFTHCARAVFEPMMEYLTDPRLT